MFRLSSVYRALFCLMILTGMIPQAATSAEIHDLAREGDVAAISKLILADPELVGLATDQGDTPLHYAAASGRNDVVAFLLEHGSKVNERNLEDFTALLHAVSSNQHSTVRLLIENQADLEIANDYGRTPLLWCARETGDYEMAVLLLDAGANIDAADRFGTTSIELVSWRGFRQLVQLFLDRGCAVPTEGDPGRMTMDHAMGKGLDRLYARLVEEGVEVELAGGESGSGLHRAAVGGSAMILADLLDRGVDIDATDGFGWTALHHAADRGRTDAVRLLLERGADPELRTRSGWSARNLAVTRQNFQVEQILTSAHPPRRFPTLEGSFLGQLIPENGGSVFAPDIASGPLGGHSSVTISPDGKHMLWHQYSAVPDSGYWTGTVYESLLENGRWTEPRRAWFALIGDDVPFFHPSGERLFFMSRRPVENGGQSSAERIWVMDRTADGWTIPKPLPDHINNMRQHWLFSVAENGDLYFGSRRGADQGVFVSLFRDGEYCEPEFLGFGGDTPFVARDGSYLITLDFVGNERVNYIRFRTKDDTWGEPIDIRSAAGNSVSGLCPVVSPDGKAFFYLASPWGPNNVCWADAGFIEDLKKKS